MKKIPGYALLGQEKMSFGPEDDGKSPSPGDLEVSPGTSISESEEVPWFVPARVKDIFLRLKKTTPDERADMTRENVEKALKAITDLNKRRLVLGEILFVQREIFKMDGRRDFTAWVEGTLHLASSTAYDYIKEWKQINCVPVDEDDERAQPSRDGEALINALAADERMNARTAPCPRVEDTTNEFARMRTTSPELDYEDTRIVIHLGPVKHERNARFRDLRKQDPAGVHQVFKETFDRLVPEEDAGEAVREQEPTAGEVIILGNGASSASQAPQPEPAPATA